MPTSVDLERTRLVSQYQWQYWGCTRTIEDTEKGPRDSDGSSEITFGRGEGVRGTGGFEEEEGKEDEDLAEDAGVVVESVYAERVEAGEEDEVGRPSVPEREWEVDPYYETPTGSQSSSSKGIHAFFIHSSLIFSAA